MAFYEAELTYLRDMGNEFAAEYPKVANRLDLSNTEIADPFVERLLEGVAFLTARIQLKMEAEFPVFTQSLLTMVYPHYAAPTPSMAIVQITPSDTLRSTPAGVDLPAGTELRSLLGTEDQTNCVFRTAHALHLLPIDVAEAEYIGAASAVAALGLPGAGRAKAAIRVRLRSQGPPFTAIALQSVSFYLGGPELARMRLYEQLSAHVLGVRCPPDRAPGAVAGAHRRGPAATGRVRAGRGDAARSAANLRRLPPAARILRAARTLPVLHPGRAGPRGHPAARGRSWRS